MPNSNNNVATLRPNVREVLTSAVLINAELNFAQLQDQKRLQQTLDITVVPERRQIFRRFYTAMGKYMAVTVWHYPTVRDAQIRSGYYIVTKMYKVDQLAANHAVISLYWENTFKTKDDLDQGNLEHQVYGLSIMVLKRVGGKWLFVGTKTPTVNQAPTAQVGLSAEQMNTQFQPYLGGFHVYSGSG
jgi:hypothetical protein